jgi:hypothetical protein
MNHSATIAFLGALLFSNQSNAIEEKKISLVCDLSGKEEMASSKYPTKTYTIKGADSFIFTKNDLNHKWQYVRNGDDVVSEADSTAIPWDDKSTFNIQTRNKITVEENLIFISKYQKFGPLESNGDKFKLIIEESNIKINRLTRVFSEERASQFDYAGGFIAKTTRTLQGLCSKGANKF